MINFFKKLRFNHLFKNFIILIPSVTIAEFKFKNDATILLEGFIVISLITLLCYLINDYFDQNIDKINKLKKSYNYSNKELFFGCVFFSIFIILFSISFELYSNIFLYLYFINFLIYNFFIKTIRILDIIFLNNFYLIRILYGKEIFEIELTSGFLLFFYFFFMSLSLSKRLTQIQINNLKKHNKILQYSEEDKKNLTIFITIFFTLCLILFGIYLLDNCCIDLNQYNLFRKANYETKIIISIFISLILWIVRAIYLLKNNLINEDFYKYFIKDKFSYFLLIFIITVGIF